MKMFHWEINLSPALNAWGVNFIWGMFIDSVFISEWHFDERRPFLKVNQATNLEVHQIFDG